MIVMNDDDDGDDDDEKDDSSFIKWKNSEIWHFFQIIRGHLIYTLSLWKLYEDTLKIHPLQVQNEPQFSLKLVVKFQTSKFFSKYTRTSCI